MLFLTVSNLLFSSIIFSCTSRRVVIAELVAPAKLQIDVRAHCPKTLNEFFHLVCVDHTLAH